MTDPQKDQSDFDKAARAAADLFLYAPVGLARQLSKHLPDLAKSGREVLQTPLQAAKFMGKHTVDQQWAKHREATTPTTTAEATPQEPAASAEPVVVDVPVTEQTVPLVPADPATLPIEGYASLSASQVLSHLQGLSHDELDTVAAYERATRNRKSVLSRIAQLRNA